jgi:tungstate transport system ATP-binding protein
MTTVLQLQQVSVQLGGHVVLKDVSLHIQAGERVALVGVNGCGKSTLLRAAHGLLKVSKGQRHLAPNMQQAMVFQRPHMLRTSVLRFVAWGLWLQGVAWRDAQVRAVQALVHAGLQDLANRSARTLSGGQQQRLALARAWALQPNFVLLDEPTSSLDPHAKREVERLLHTWVAQASVTLLFSSHNLGQVKRLATRVIYLEAARVLADLPGDEFFNSPLGETHPEAHLFLKGELG